jgi:hypothetical protein
MGSAESITAEMPSNTNDMPPWVLVVFEFSDWRTRSNLMMTSRRWWRNTGRELLFYRFLCRRLALEHAVYIPPSLPSNDTWKSFYLEMYKLRNIWKPEGAMHITASTDATGSGLTGAEVMQGTEGAEGAEGTEGTEGVEGAATLPYEAHRRAERVGERFKISVIARFRPADLLKEVNEEKEGGGDGGGEEEGTGCTRTQVSLVFVVT